ncbi:MAG: hypothetical protein ACLSDQ_13430 [Adlercreutzia equolifaciens]
MKNACGKAEGSSCAPAPAERLRLPRNGTVLRGGLYMSILLRPDVAGSGLATELVGLSALARWRRRNRGRHPEMAQRRDL